MANVQLLLSLLDVIQNTDVIESISANFDHPYIRAIQYCANETLIKDMGKINDENISILNSKGYNVRPGEQDSFGWVTGCIYTNKGIIIFG